jgi:hypothetical protein
MGARLTCQWRRRVRGSLSHDRIPSLPPHVQLPRRAMNTPVSRLIPVVCALVLVSATAAACSSAIPTGRHTPTPTLVPTPTTSAPASPSPSPGVTEVPVTPCPTPAEDLHGLPPVSPAPVPSTYVLPTTAQAPAGAALYGAGVPYAPIVVYAIAPAAAGCQAPFASADGGFGIRWRDQADPQHNVTLTYNAGGAGPETDLSCPYIQADRTADIAFRSPYYESVICAEPTGVVLTSIPTGVANDYLEAVFAPPGVKAPNLPNSGMGRYSTMALFTFHQTDPLGGDGQEDDCTLPDMQRDVCVAGLTFFLATQAAVGKDMGAAEMATALADLHGFLSSHQ